LQVDHGLLADSEEILVRPIQIYQVGIGQPLALQIVLAVLDYLDAAGYSRERDILAGIL
jgi:hypothetical protein